MTSIKGYSKVHLRNQYGSLERGVNILFESVRDQNKTGLGIDLRYDASYLQNSVIQLYNKYLQLYQLYLEDILSAYTIIKNVSTKASLAEQIKELPYRKTLFRLWSKQGCVTIEMLQTLFSKIHINNFRHCLLSYEGYLQDMERD